MFAGRGLLASTVGPKSTALGATAFARPVALATTGSVIPTAPGPNDVFNEGANCTFSWTPDPSGVWTQTDVELMTGDNFNMVYITTVASFDGTDASISTFSYPCPEVTPNSAIYFYQFTTPKDPAAREWTTRFAIADAQGNTTPPPNATQPGADPSTTPIPWGTGALKDPSQAAPEPAYLLPAGAAPSGNATASASASGSAGGSVSASMSVTASASVSANATDSAGSTSALSTSVSAVGTDSVTVGGATVTHTNTVTPAPAAPTTSSAVSSSGQNGSGNGSGSNNGALSLAGARTGLGQALLALGLTAVGAAVLF
ncbi:hypothetical protein C2E23DRAFT_732131 [Lenzites betulinus]|nr:hypothetical protein C2E23DRAFT_732131 [Lenzites betulinus]